MFEYRFGRNGQSTGDPWIDAGIVGFFDYALEEEEEKNLGGDYGIQIDPEKYALSSDNIQKIGGYLQDVFRDVKSARYIVKTGNRSLIYDETQDKLTLTDRINLVPIIGMLFPGGNLQPKYDRMPFSEHLRNPRNQYRVPAG